jgi:hypothetical protein
MGGYGRTRNQGFELITERLQRGDHKTIARFQCAECPARLDIGLAGGLNPRWLANQAKQKGWEADAYYPQACLCPDCTTKPTNNDTDSELKKLERKMAQQPPPNTPEPPPIVQEPQPQPAVVTPREPTSDQRTLIRKLLDANFDDELGFYAAGWSDARIAEEVNVPRLVVERLRDTAFGPLKVTPEIVALREEVAKLFAKLEAVEREFRQWTDVFRGDVTDARGALQAISKRVAAEVKAAA